MKNHENIYMHAYIHTCNARFYEYIPLHVGQSTKVVCDYSSHDTDLINAHGSSKIPSIPSSSCINQPPHTPHFEKLMHFYFHI